MAEAEVEEITSDGADEQGDAPDGSAPIGESAGAARSSFGLDRPAYGGPRGPQRASGGGRRDGGRERGGYGRRRVCGFCMDNVKSIDYKDTTRLRRFLSERGKIEPRRKTGTCAKHQRWLTTALQRARQLALLPYTAEHVRFLGR
jgi:small subunit ribosomal protein S18